MAFRLGFIGAGNMAEGILAAVLQKGVHAPGDIIAADPASDRRQLFAERFGVAVTADGRQVLADAGDVVLAVKPQTFGEVARQLADLARPEHLFISIMAGVSTASIEAALGGAAGAGGLPARVVRAMPNLPIRVGAGMTGLCRGRFASAEDLDTARALFAAGGGTVLVDEDLMDAVTAVSGSGPAYFYYFVEALARGGAACGLSEADALELAQHTCLGAARMMLESGERPEELRRKVTSKGGTTQAAIEHMRQAGVSEAIEAAVRAAFERGRELGK